MPQLSLAATRELLGWSQSELARRAGESVSNIRDLEQGINTNPSWNLVSHIVDALREGGLKNVQASDLFPVKERKAS